MSSLVNVGWCLKILLADACSSSDSSEDEILHKVMKDSDGEEELVLRELIQNLPTNPICKSKYLINVVPHYTEFEFRRHFRVTTSLFENLCDMMERSEQYNALRFDKRLPAKTHIAVFLWFAGQESSSLRDVAKRFGLSISSVCRVIHRTSMFLSSMAPSVIVWPNEESKKRSSTFFADKCGFGNAIGCIDATRVIIDQQSDRKNEYMDRTGSVSLSLQAICNEKKKFINVFIGHPGSCHDSWILEDSLIYKKIDLACGDYYLLGDSAYPCSKHLITPYKDNGQLSEEQKNFNCKLKSGREAIVHCIGILKQRFKQLNYCKIKGIRKLCHFIMACCVLHNITNEDDFDFVYEEENIEELDLHMELFSTNNAIRDAILKQIT